MPVCAPFLRSWAGLASTRSTAHHSNWCGLISFKCLRALHVRGRADDFVRTELFAEAVAQATLDEVDSKIGDVNSDPAPLQPFRHRDGRATTAEGSSTTSPSLLLLRTMRSSRASGFWVG